MTMMVTAITSTDCSRFAKRYDTKVTWKRYKGTTTIVDMLLFVQQQLLVVVLLLLLLCNTSYKNKNKNHSIATKVFVTSFAPAFMMKPRLSSSLSSPGIIMTMSTAKTTTKMSITSSSITSSSSSSSSSRTRQSYTNSRRRITTSALRYSCSFQLAAMAADDDDDSDDGSLSSSGSGSSSSSDDGINLAAELFKIAQSKGIQLSDTDLMDEDDDDDDEYDDGDATIARNDAISTSKKVENDDDEEEEEDDDDETEPNYPQGAINAFLGYDTGNVGEKLAGNVSLTNDQLYSAMKERVLDTAGGFLEFVKPVSDDDEDDDDEDEDESTITKDSLLVPSKQSSDQIKPYVAPTIVPDSELTAGEVVMQVLDSLLHNDIPTPNKGVEILFGYSSDGSQIKNEIGLTPLEYYEFLKETEYKILFTHGGATIDKADYSFDGKKAYFTARLKPPSSTGAAGAQDTVSVNFILSTTGVEDDSCWLIDSILIRPQSMRRRRRK